MKILLDNNAIDKIVNNIDFIKLHKEISFYICREIAEEVSRKSDTYKPLKNIITLFKIAPTYLPNSVFVLAHSLLDGESQLCDKNTALVYENILKETKSNIPDAIIAATAVSNGCTLITYDDELYKKMKKHGCSVITFEELRDLVK